MPANYIAEGANKLIIKCKDVGLRGFRVDAMELGGSLGVGKKTRSSTDDGRVDPELIKTGVPSAADPNPQHWPTKLDSSTGVSDLHFRVWVDPDVADKASFTFKTAISNDVSGVTAFEVYVNGSKKVNVNAKSEWKEYPLNPGVLNGGWNDFDFKTSNSCISDFGYYRFEAVLPEAFGYPPFPGLSVFIR